MTMRERIYGGKLFTDGCEGLPEDRTNCKKRLMVFNQSSPENIEERMKALGDVLCTQPKAWIEPPFSCCYGYNIHFKGGAYLNVNCSFIDDGEIHIGHGVMFGPSVTIATVGHPIDPQMRGYMYTDPVTIEDNCWIGAGAVICPGVTIGENTVIAAGSVVNRDIPANCVAGGNPCKVIREIGEEDRKYYYKNRPFQQADLEECRRLDSPPAEGEGGNREE